MLVLMLGLVLVVPVDISGAGTGDVRVDVVSRGGSDVAANEMIV